MSKKILHIKLLMALLSLSLLFSCNAKKEKKQENEDQTISDQSFNKKQADAAVNCDTSFWKYVYNPERLEVITKCKTVTGIIEESNADEDGDQHMLLKLDIGQEDMLTKRNYKK